MANPGVELKRVLDLYQFRVPARLEPLLKHLVILGDLVNLEGRIEFDEETVLRCLARRLS